MPPEPPLAVGFLGAGQMATALALGWQAAGRLDAARSAASCRTDAGGHKFRERTGLRVGTDNRAPLAADALILGVKPQQLPALAADIAAHLEPRHLVVSIAAGVTLARLAELFGPQIRLVRVMPNTPCVVRASASAISAGPRASPGDAALVVELFRAVGLALEVPEAQLNAVTGLSGSGPAYAFVMIDALADAGVRGGLSRATATQLAAQTLLGAAKMVLETGQHPGQLKDAVASPAGTTIAGLYALEQAGIRAGLMDAVAASQARADELGR